MNYLLIVLSALLIIIPLSYPQFYFLGWIALLPFLLAISNDSPRKGFKKGWLLGFFISAGSISWLAYPLINFSGLSVFVCLIFILILFILMGIIYGIWSWIYLFIQDNKSFSSFWLAFSWTGMEYLRYHLIPDLSFGFLGYTQVSFSYLLQLADIGGLFLISFIVLLINGYLFKLFKEGKLKQIIPILLIFMIIIVYGSFKLNLYTNREYESLQIGLVQTHLSPIEKWDPEKIKSNLNYLLTESKKLNQADLIIWPESALTFDLIRNEYYRDIFIDAFQDLQPYLQTGSLAIIEDVNKKYNSAFLISSDGKIKQRYNKMRLVPFGEYMPLKGIVEFITRKKWFSQTPGQEVVLFEIPSAQWRTLICSEILYPDLAKLGIEKADFIVNQSNEAWFSNMKLQRQIWTAASFRAVENRRSVVKTGNMAYSGVIRPTGSYELRKPPEGKNTFLARVELIKGETLYQQWGDFIGFISSGIIVVLFMIKLLFRKHGR